MDALERIAQRIKSKNAMHAKKIKKNLSDKDDAFRRRAGAFFDHYENWLAEDGLSLDYAVDCYLNMLADMSYESIQFLRTGSYSSQSFEEVKARVYDNPEVMDDYMHGLLLSQFLWSHHYQILIDFSEKIRGDRTNISRYLEIGAGHGLYISEAIDVLGTAVSFELVDISASSLNIARKMINSEGVKYVHSDIFDYSQSSTFDWITMGEVLEHVEDPVKLLRKLRSLLNEGGRIYLTTPTNAPAIDHIYLFRNAQDIRDVITAAGLSIESERCIYSEDVDEDFAEKHKVSMMYVGVLTAAE